MAVRGLPSGDLILTTDDEQTRTEWLRSTEWLRVIGDRARVKKREFIAIAHRIRLTRSRTRNRQRRYTDRTQSFVEMSESSDLYGRRSSFAWAVGQGPFTSALQSQSGQIPLLTVV